jgi:hypothetical protein
LILSKIFLSGLQNYGKTAQWRGSATPNMRLVLLRHLFKRTWQGRLSNHNGVAHSSRCLLRFAGGDMEGFGSERSKRPSLRAKIV